MLTNLIRIFDMNKFKYLQMLINRFKPMLTDDNKFLEITSNNNKW